VHELGIAQSIIDIVTKVANENGGGRISRVSIQAGELRALVKDQLTFCFDFAAEGTQAAGAKLDVEVIPVEALCESCNREFRVRNFEFICPDCGGTSVRVLRGKELRILEVELA
jgi:hydrogenase nickel incorporation protein HypA/HybF